MAILLDQEWDKVGGEDGWRLVRGDQDGCLIMLLRWQGNTGQIKPCESGILAVPALLGLLTLDGATWLAYPWQVGDSLADRLANGPLDQDEASRVGLLMLDAAAYLSFGAKRLCPIPAAAVLFVGDAVIMAGLLPAAATEVPLTEVVGELLYTVYAGHPPQANQRGEIPLLSDVREGVDARLESLIMGALGEPGFRTFATLLDFRSAVADYLAEQACVERVESAPDDPAEPLIRALRASGDFPALSGAISTIARIMDDDSQRLQTLSAVILRDFSLTNRVLGLANSASYSQFGSGISTISRAVMVLGFSAVKSLAITLVMIEQLQNRAIAAEMLDEVAKSFLCSLLARHLADASGFAHREEARVAGMVHNLGRMVARFYFHDKVAAAQADISLGIPHDQAVRNHLGASYDELARSVGREWGLPLVLLHSMQTEREWLHRPQDQEEWLKLLANAAAALMDAILLPVLEKRQTALAAVREDFGGVLRQSAQSLRLAADAAVRDCLRDAAIFGVQVQNSPVFGRLRQIART